MASQALTYALLANPRLIETGYRAARDTAITLSKVVFYGAVGFGTYKALSTLIERSQARQQTKQGIKRVNDTAYKAALYFTSLFQSDGIDRGAIKDLVKAVYIHGDFARTADFYFQINFGKSWKSDCVAYLFGCRKFDSSGNLIEHLKTALGDEYQEIIPYLGDGRR